MSYIEFIKRCGADFSPTPDDEQEIRRGGAYLGKKGLDDLIAAIKSNYRPDVTQQPMPTPTPDEPKPNITPVGFRKLHITYDPVSQAYTEADTGILAVVAFFRNAHDFGKAISEAKEIRAHIIYQPSEYYEKLRKGVKDAEKTTPGFAGVNDGIWLNEKNPVVNFARGETKALVMAIELPTGGFGGFDAFGHTFSNVNGIRIYIPTIPIMSADKYLVRVFITGGERVQSFV
jgi:hypothetical protein